VEARHLQSSEFLEAKHRQIFAASRHACTAVFGAEGLSLSYDPRGA
jgi:hypothetical protein